MSHKDSPTGQQFHVRYKRDEEGGVHTYWSGVYTDRDHAEAVAEVYEKHRSNGARIYDIAVFVRDLSPWREDTGPEPCGNCRFPKNEHPGGGWNNSGACQWWSK